MIVLIKYLLLNQWEIFEENYLHMNIVGQSQKLLLKIFGCDYDFENSKYSQSMSIIKQEQNKTNEEINESKRTGLISSVIYSLQLNQYR